MRNCGPFGGSRWWNKTGGVTLLRDKEAPAKFLPCLLWSTNMRVVAVELHWVLAAFQRLIKKMWPFSYRCNSPSTRSIATRREFHPATIRKWKTKQPSHQNIIQTDYRKKETPGQTRDVLCRNQVSSVTRLVVAHPYLVGACCVPVLHPNYCQSYPTLKLNKQQSLSSVK